MALILEDLRYIHINDLKAYIDFNSDQSQHGNAVITEDIGLTYNFSDGNLIIQYSIGGKNKLQSYSIVYYRSNLNGSKMYYFECPYTFKRVTALYIVEGRFYSRHCFKYLYETQAESKQVDLYGRIQAIFKKAKLQEELRYEIDKPYSKAFYNGKANRKISSLISKIDRL